PYTRNLAFDKILKEIMLKRRKEELELYKLYSNDEGFKAAWRHSIEEMLSRSAARQAEITD
ncbi:MAG: hypothetical protein ACSHXD_20225, partial [Marinosulfonomonas sp.]